MNRLGLHSIRLLSLVAILFAALPGRAAAQIEVAPTRVILSMRERSQEVNVTNTSESAVEVTTELGFKVIRHDSLGGITLDSGKTAEETARSGKEWLKVFPRRFTLAPRTSRIVRVMVTIPDAAPEGEFWARLIVSGTPVNSSMKIDGDSAQGIETSLAMRMELDLPVIIRKGNVETGIAFDGMQARMNGENTLLLVDMHRTGNSAYRGTLKGVLRDSRGAVAAETGEQFTAEFSLRRTLLLPRVPDGSYTLELEAESVKKGGANEAVIPAPTARQQYRLTVNGSTINVGLE